MNALAKHGFVIALGIATTLAWWSAGIPATRWFGGTAPTPVERHAVQLVLGFGITGCLLYGLGMAGLFFPSMCLVAFVVAGAGGLRSRRSTRYRHIASPSRLSRIWMLIALPPLLLSPLLLVPSLGTDAWHYHFAAAEQFLRSHRYATDGQNAGFHLEMLSEFQNVFAVITRSEALATVVSLIPYLAATAAAGAWLTRRTSPLAGGMGVGFLLALGHAMSTAVWGKNDAACAGACLVALMAQADRRYPAAAALWGVAAATKINGLLFAGIAGAAVLLVRPSQFRSVSVGLLFSAPYLLRSWYMKGDPHWPVFSGRLPGALWDAPSQAALDGMVRGTPSMLGALTAFGEECALALPALAALVPASILMWREIPAGLGRIGLLSLGYTTLLVFGVGYESGRLSFPALAVGCLIAAVTAASLIRRVNGVRRSLILLATVCMSWPPLPRVLAESLNGMSVRYLTGVASQCDWFESRWSTAWQTRHAIAALPDLRTVLLINERSIYLWPARVRTEEFVDRSPTWALTRDTNSIARLSIRLRQGNVSHIVFNSVEPFNLIAHGRYYRYFQWNARQLRLLHDHMQSDWHLERSPDAGHLPNGAHYVWSVRKHQRSSPGALPDLPGAKHPLWNVLLPLLETNDIAACLPRADALCRTYPDVLAYRHLRGSLLSRAGRWKESYAELELAVRGGYVGDFSAGIAAAAAVNMRRPDLAIPMARIALRLHPDRRAEVTETLAAAMALDAVLKAEANPARVLKFLAEAREAVALNPPGSPLVRLCLGAVLRRAGELAEARSILESLARSLPPDSTLGRECLRELGLSRTQPGRR